MELLTELGWLFGGHNSGFVWRIDPGLRLQCPGHAQDEAVVARAVPKRQREFRSGRNVARAALNDLGRPASVIPVGLKGMPIWPEGILGSISHCDDMSVAVVARSGDVSGIGVDVECAGQLCKSDLSLVLTPRDRDASASEVWGGTVFSAKEAVYKAIFPDIRLVLDFAEAAVVPLHSPAMSRGKFTVEPLSERLKASGLCTRLHGRWLRTPDHVFTLVQLGAAQATKRSATLEGRQS